MKKLFLFATIILTTACSHQSLKEKSLYDQLGGEIGVDQLIVTTLQRAHSDERIAFLFEDIDEANLVIQLNDQICVLSGGPCSYEGLSMQDAHAGMALTKADFDIFVELFIEAMKENQISFSAQNQLLAMLAPMRPDIIEQ